MEKFSQTNPKYRKKKKKKKNLIIGQNNQEFKIGRSAALWTPGLVYRF